MTNTAVAAQGDRESEISFRPYPPSWVDRFTAWVDRLPVPNWAIYLGVWLALFLPYTAVKWRDGAYPSGTIYDVHVLSTSTGICILALMHYLDRVAGEALAKFRPMLNVSKVEYEQLHYKLTTLPARLTLLVTIAEGILALPSGLIGRSDIPSFKLGTSPLASGLELFIIPFMWCVIAVFVYHTFHQLRLVSYIQTHCARINLFQLGPLYAFSTLTAKTAIGVTIINYAWAVAQPTSTVRPTDPSITAFFALVAVITFVWPLFGVHRLLHSEKQRLLAETARRQADTFAELDQRLDAGELGDLGGLNQAISCLATKQAVLSKISTWPWQVETLRGVVAAMSLPLLIYVLQQILLRLLFGQP